MIYNVHIATNLLKVALNNITTLKKNMHDVHGCMPNKYINCKYCLQECEVTTKKPRTLLPDFTRSDSNSSSGDSSIPDNTIPEETSSWTGILLPILRISVDTVTEDPFKIFETAYVDHFLGKKAGPTEARNTCISDIYSFFRKDNIKKMKHCFRRLCTETIELDYNHIQEVPFQKVLELRNYLKSVKWSSIHEFPVEYG